MAIKVSDGPLSPTKIGPPREQAKSQSKKGIAVGSNFSKPTSQKPQVKDYGWIDSPKQTSEKTQLENTQTIAAVNADKPSTVSLKDKVPIAQNALHKHPWMTGVWMASHLSKPPHQQNPNGSWSQISPPPCPPVQPKAKSVPILRKAPVKAVKCYCSWDQSKGWAGPGRIQWW
jgi:hypothetical protein